MTPTTKNDDARGQAGKVGTTEDMRPELCVTAAACVKPSFPFHGTQPARLLATLLRGAHVGPMKGLNALGIYRLSDTVLQLRRLGWAVITKRVDVSNRFGEACHVADYHLPAEIIEEAGSEGREFAAHEFRIMSERRVA